MGTAYTDTMLTGVKYTSSNKIAQVYVTYFDDVRIYHLEHRRASHKPLSRYFMDSGVPENIHLSVCLSVCRSGLRVPIAYSLLGGGVPIPEQRLCWTLDSVHLRFEKYYVDLALGPRPMS